MHQLSIKIFRLTIIAKHLKNHALVEKNSHSFCKWNQLTSVECPIYDPTQHHKYHTGRFNVPSLCLGRLCQGLSDWWEQVMDSKIWKTSANCCKYSRKSLKHIKAHFFNSAQKSLNSLTSQASFLLTLWATQTALSWKVSKALTLLASAREGL